MITLAMVVGGVMYTVARTSAGVIVSSALGIVVSAIVVLVVGAI